MNRTRTKTAARDRAYAILRLVWLGGPCEARLSGHCQGQATEVHHTAKRTARHMLNVDSWAALCHPCHMWIEAHPNDARKMGLRRHPDQEVPVTNRYARCKACADPVFWVHHIGDNRESIPLQADQETEMPVDYRDRGELPRVVWQENHRQTSIDEGLEWIVVHQVQDGIPLDPDTPVWGSHLEVCRGRAT